MSFIPPDGQLGTLQSSFLSGSSNENHFEYIWSLAGAIWQHLEHDMMSSHCAFKKAFTLFGIFFSISTAQQPGLVPYASPSGFAIDITTWLSVSNDSQAGICKFRMFENINVPGAANGTVIASQSRANPDYAYNWVRDAALTMDTVSEFYAAASNPSAKSTYEAMLFQYAQARAIEQQDPSLAAGLGEPKFFLNNTLFTGPWGRPQNDGPAESATTLINFANAFLDSGGSIDTVRRQIYDSNTYPTQAPVQKDLLFVASNWSSPSFDLWEEESSDHFFNAMVSHRSLVLGSKIAARLDDTSTSETLSIAADAIAAALPGFWDPQRQLIVYEIGPVLANKSSYKDIAVILGVLHGYADDGIFSYITDQVLASAYQIVTSFLTVYPIASTTTDASGQVLGIPVG
jgi:glucoamylase